MPVELVVRVPGHALGDGIPHDVLRRGKHVLFLTVISNDNGRSADVVVVVNTCNEKLTDASAPE